MKRFIWASLDFAAARDLGRLISENREQDSDNMAVRAAQTGIIVSYARPFGENHGLGSLPSRFRTSFDPPGLQVIHDGMLLSRNLVEAHNNVLGQGTIFRGGNPVEIEIEVHKTGRVEWSVPPPLLSDKTLDHAIELLDYQLARLEREILEVGEVLARLQGRKSGTYILGVDYP